MSSYIEKLRQRVGNELLILPSVTAIIFDEENHVLLAKHADTNRWVAPGGSVEPNERPADAVVREVREETGLIVEPITILGVFGGPEFEVVYSNGDRVTYVMTVYECKILGGELKPDESETVELRYVGASDLAHLDLAEWATVVLPEVYGARAALWR
ncbi:MAG: NUDIX domain-containing protein [Acidobacteriota bacterium]|nr:NUDIX domain-containing protein [Acidobacteriota bacterium]